MAHSDCFKIMFTSEFNEKNQNVIVMKDLKLNEFGQLLNLMYGRKHLNGNCIFY